MTNPRPRPRRLLPGTITRPEALLVCVSLFACSAILIVVEKRGLLDLDGVANNAVGRAGAVLAVFGGLYFMHICWADRFQVSIGRLMIVVAVAAVLFQGALAYRQHVMKNLPRPPGIFAKPTQ